MIIFRFSRINNESTKAKDYANVKHNTAPCACKNREMSLLDKFRNDLESSSLYHSSSVSEESSKSSSKNCNTAE